MRRSALIVSGAKQAQESDDAVPASSLLDSKPPSPASGTDTPSSRNAPESTPTGSPSTSPPTVRQSRTSPDSPAFAALRQLIRHPAAVQLDEDNGINQDQ